jgi:protein-S-isoprenylcysteine O-methyltransferase Ste14
MYVGLTAVYAGVALLRNAAWPLILLPVVLIALWFLVIRREERYLTHAFGDHYTRYQQRVRRWL